MIHNASFHATATREITLLTDRKAETGRFARSSSRFQRNFGLKLANYLRKTGNLLRRSLRPATTMTLSSSSMRPTIEEEPLAPESVLNALEAFASSARRLESPDPNQEEYTAQQRTELANWAAGWKDKLKVVGNLRGSEGANLLSELRMDVNRRSSPQTADMVEALQQAVEPVLDVAKKGPVIDQIDEKIKHNLPVLIYFENYGILDSAIWLPRFIEDLNRDPNDSRVRTINAMFKHVGLDPKEITTLGDREVRRMQEQGYPPTPEQIAADQQRKDKRSILLNSASIDISGKFSEWWSQRRHKIRYQGRWRFLPNLDCRRPSTRRGNRA